MIFPKFRHHQKMERESENTSESLSFKYCGSLLNKADFKSQRELQKNERRKHSLIS